ncbi:kinase-like protein, partial [Rhizophagus irregularis]
MAENSKIKDLNYYIDWLNYSISEEHIRYYEYSDFTNIQQIGKGSYGTVFCVNWKNSNRLFALKSFNNNEETLKEVVKELRLLRRVDDHENIISFYGITKLENTTHQTNNYSLVLEFANNGTLNTYLNKHFNELKWNDKYRLAFQLASAVEFLHEKDIIHRDL